LSKVENDCQVEVSLEEGNDKVVEFGCKGGVVRLSDLKRLEKGGDWMM